MPPPPSSRSRRRSRRSKQRTRLRGGVGEKRKNADNGSPRPSARSRATAERLLVKQKLSMKPLLTPRDGSPTFNGTLLDKLCSWQGLSAENLLSNFNSLVQTLILGSVDLTSGVDGLKDEPSLLLLLIEDILEEEDKFEFLPVEVRDKLRMIKEVLAALAAQTNAAMKKDITSVVNQNCPRRPFASSSSSISEYLGEATPPDQTSIRPDTVRLPTVEMFEVDKMERKMGTRLRDYLLLKDATRFRNAVVVNASHGKIKATRESCEVFEIPTGKSVTIVSAVTPGISYYTDAQNIDAFLDSLVTDDFLQDHFFFRREPMNDFIVRHSMDVQALRNIMDLQNHSFRDVGRPEQGDEEDFNLWVTHHRPVSVKSFVEGDVAANREIYVETSEPSPWGVWVLDEKLPHVFNVQKVARSLTPPTNGYRGFETDLNTVLTNVWNRGVDHITYFDFSCLPFQEKLKKTSRVRLSAEEAVTRAGLAGGARRRRKK